MRNHNALEFASAFSRGGYAAVELLTSKILVTVRAREDVPVFLH